MDERLRPEARENVAGMQHDEPVLHELSRRPAAAGVEGHVGIRMQRIVSSGIELALCADLGALLGPDAGLAEHRVLNIDSVSELHQ